MVTNKFDLDNIIRKSYREVIEYFNKNGVKVEGLKLTILESPKPLIKIYGEDKVNEMIKENVAGIYDGETTEIYIIKSAIKKYVGDVLINLDESSIGNLFTISYHKILWPVYKNDDDIEKVIMENTVKTIIAHEVGHHKVGNNEWGASVVECLVHFYKNKLYKYPEVYKIMEKNVEICEKYINKEDSSSYQLDSSLVPYSFGACFANDIIYAYENILNENKESPKLNIKDMIEKIKYFSEVDGIEITKMVNTLLKDYINIKNKLNIKANMLSYLLKKYLI
jgi:hypothetical protein